MTTPAILPATVSGRGLTHRLLRNPLAVLSLAVLVAVVLVAILAPLLTPWDPAQAKATEVLKPITPEHLLGTDSAGRDILSRLLWGARNTLISAFITVAIAFALGVPAGLAAGYWGGRIDAVLSWISELLMSIPNLVIVLAFITVIGPDAQLVMLIFGVLFSPGSFRLTRTSTRAVRGELYIDAAQVSGLSDLRIIGKHVTRRVRSPLLIQASMTAGVAIVLQSGLDFLGVGDPRDPRWGQMINDAFQNIYRQPTMIVWPGLAIGITVAALALFGVALRDEIESAGRPVSARKHIPTTVPELPEAGTSALLDVRDLTVSHALAGGGSVEVVGGVSFSVNEGEVVGLVGESGSGKSQTAFASLGLLPVSGFVSGGAVRFRGETVAGPGVGPTALGRVRGTDIGYVPQEPMANLDPSFTIGHQLVEPIMHHQRIGRRAATAESLELLSHVGIVDPRRTFDAYPHEVSGGMAQRVLIAGAVSCKPSLLVADEPTTALDVTVQAEVLELLRQLQRESGMALLLITHNLGVVADICDRVAVMRNGLIIEQGAVRDVFSSPQDPYTASLLASTLEGAASRLELDKEHS